MFSSTPLTDKLCHAKSLIQEVMNSYPEGAYGRVWLEEAIELISKSEMEVAQAEEMV